MEKCIMESSSAHIRLATAEDLPAISEIYNYFVQFSACTFDTEPRQMPAWREWLAAHQDRTPVIVAVRNGETVGWGSLSKWNSRCAYRFSVEDSVYIKPGVHRQGLGRVLLGELIAQAQKHQHRNIVAQIADGITASIALHEAMGFRHIGTLKKIGYKFDRWIDVWIWQLQLRDDDSPPEDGSGAGCI
jgi:L-amino acid N-acyltransferase YncA